MADTIPFLFCRYVMLIGDEVLDDAGAFEALNSIQGQFLPQGPKEEREGSTSIVVMRPRREEVQSEKIVTWAMGHRPGHRTVTDYDPTDQELKFAIRGDTHILHTNIIAIPRLGAMAVMDRTNALNMNARSALSRTRAAFRHIEDGAFIYTFLAPGDVAAIQEKLDLLEYAYTVRRINPTPPGVLSAALDASMAQEGIGIYRGIAKPMPGEVMKPDEGIIEATSELADAGYGVRGFKGRTEEGHLAQIRKPPFSLDKAENLKQQEKEHPLRIFIESEGDTDELIASVVAELVRSYSDDDAA